MEVECRDALLPEPLGHVLRLLAVARVEDGAARHGAQDVERLLQLFLGIADHVAEVLAGKAHAEHAVVAEVEVAADVVDDEGRGRGREGERGHAGQLLAHLRNAQVVGAEVVAPLRDAVRLVHGDKETGMRAAFFKKSSEASRSGDTYKNV